MSRVRSLFEIFRGCGEVGVVRLLRMLVDAMGNVVALSRMSDNIETSLCWFQFVINILFFSVATLFGV